MHQVMWFGKEEALVGKPLMLGEEAPDFSALDSKFVPVSFGKGGASVRIVSSVPSLDTGVCSHKHLRRPINESKRLTLT